MARKLRVEYPGAIYHLIDWGDRPESISKDDEDRQRFLGALGEACVKTASRGRSQSRLLENASTSGVLVILNRHFRRWRHGERIMPFPGPQIDGRRECITKRIV